MRRSPLASLALLLPSCAAPGPRVAEPAATLQSTNTRIEVAATTYSLELTRRLDAWVTTLPFPANQVWATVPGVYAGLGLTDGGLVEPGRRAYGYSGRMPPRLAGRRPSAYLQCGHSLGGANADIYDIRLSVVTAVDPNGESTRVSTLVDATATPRGVSSNPVTCTTTGELERAIAEALARSATL